MLYVGGFYTYLFGCIPFTRMRDVKCLGYIIAVHPSDPKNQIYISVIRNITVLLSGDEVLSIIFMLFCS